MIYACLAARNFSLSSPHLSFFLSPYTAQQASLRSSCYDSFVVFSLHVPFLPLVLNSACRRISPTSAVKRGAESASLNKFEAARALRSRRFSLRVKNEEERKRRAELQQQLGQSSELGRLGRKGELRPRRLLCARFTCWEYASSEAVGRRFIQGRSMRRVHACNEKW